MGDDGGAGILFGGGAVFGIFLGFILGIMVGTSGSEAKWKNLAIERGIAVYNQKTGKLEVVNPEK